MNGSLSGSAPFGLRLPVAGRHPVRKEDADKPRLRRDGRLRHRRRHRVEHRQRQRHAGAAQEQLAARMCLFMMKDMDY